MRISRLRQHSPLPPNKNFVNSKDTEEVSVFDVSERDVSVLYDWTERVLVFHVSVQPDEVIHIVHVHVSPVVPAY